VKLIPSAYLKPFVKRNKNDAVYAEAICGAAQRPSMCCAAIKTEAQQAAGLVLIEFGWVARKGPSQINVLASLLD